jgi:predicted component of viral defense system (DUF524 family)
MHKYAVRKYAKICKNMQKICMKYAINMQKYALHQISVQLYKYARNMQKICNYMQYMSSRNLYAEYAEICIPHYADVGCVDRELFVPRTSISLAIT